MRVYIGHCRSTMMGQPYSFYYITDTARPFSNRGDEDKSYLHRDGQWHGSTGPDHSKSGEGGRFSTIAEAGEVARKFGHEPEVRKGVE